MFGSWLCGLSKELKSLALLGAAATCRSLWLCRNDLVFKKKRTSFPLQVIYSIIHWLCTWAVLQKLTSQDLVVAASQQLARVANRPRRFLSGHMSGSLVFGLSVISVFLF
jgi:hypothetical protein